MDVRSSLFPLLLVLLLTGCEGSTMMSHTFHNRTEDTLFLLARFDSLPWYDSTEMMLAPDHQHTVYTYDMRGKCNECGALYNPMAWVDTIELSGHTWLRYPDAGDWTTDVTEGRSWIRFDHTLNIGVADVE